MSNHRTHDCRTYGQSQPILIVGCWIVKWLVPWWSSFTTPLMVKADALDVSCHKTEYYLGQCGLRRQCNRLRLLHCLSVCPPVDRIMREVFTRFLMKICRIVDYCYGKNLLNFGLINSKWANGRYFFRFPLQYITSTFARWRLRTAYPP